MKKKSLVLMTSIALILLMTLSVIAFSWPWQATGDATFVGPYKIYKEKPRDIKVGNNKYNIRVKEVKDSNTATLSIVGIDKKVTEGETYTIGNLQIKVIAIGSWVGKYVKFSVAEVEEPVQQGEVVMTYQTTNKQTLAEYAEFGGSQKAADSGNSIYSGISIHSIQGAKYSGYENGIFYFGSTWNCIEMYKLSTITSDSASGEYSSAVPTWSYTTPAGAGRPVCIGDAYGSSSVGDMCILMRNHPCTGKDEWVAVYLKDVKNDPHLLNPQIDTGLLEVPAYTHNPTTGEVRVSTMVERPSYYEYDISRNTKQARGSFPFNK